MLQDQDQAELQLEALGAAIQRQHPEVHLAVAASLVSRPLLAVVAALVPALVLEGMCVCMAQRGRENM